MDRRSFLTALIGGFTLAGFGGATIAEAAESAPSPKPAGGDLPRETAEALDGQDAEFSRRRRRRHWHRRRRYYRRYYRPRFYRRRYYYRPYRRYWGPRYYYRPRYYYGPRYYYRPRPRFYYRYW